MINKYDFIIDILNLDKDFDMLPIIYATKTIVLDHLKIEFILLQTENYHKLVIDNDKRSLLMDSINHIINDIAILNSNIACIEPQQTTLMSEYKQQTRLMKKYELDITNINNNLAHSQNQFNKFLGEPYELFGKRISIDGYNDQIQHIQGEMLELNLLQFVANDTQKRTQSGIDGIIQNYQRLTKEKSKYLSENTYLENLLIVTNLVLSLDKVLFIKRLLEYYY